jgi:glucose-1-phosphate thymidylyltransferase
MYGILLAGGTGSRLAPITNVISKQLLPIYDKPMIYYPLSLMMASGIEKFVLVTTPRDQGAYQALLGDGTSWGIKINYVVQVEPRGIPQALTLANRYTQDSPTMLVLGDNIFYGSKIATKLHQEPGFKGAKIYGYLVNDVSSFGNVVIDSSEKVLELREKPQNVGRGFAIPGIYHLDETAALRVDSLKLSARGELEIVDLLSSYLLEGKLDCEIMDRGTAWLDTGTIEDLYAATELVRVVQERQGMLIGSPEEVAFRRGLISRTELEALATGLSNSLYGKQLLDLLKDS